MRRLAILFALFLAACGGDSGTGPDDGGGTNTNSFTASLDGTAWTASGLTIAAGANTSQLPGGLVFTGSTVTQPGKAMIISLGRITGPGTYPLGVNTGTNAGGTLSLVQGSATWWTPLIGNAGTITITSMTGGRVRGTFTATLEPLPGGGGTGVIQVTNGQFNVPINPGYAAPAADNLGSETLGTVGGAEFHGATVLGFGGGTATVIVSASTDDYLLTINMSPAEVGSLALNASFPLRTVGVVRSTPAGGGSWGTLQGATGTITISSITGTRIVGSVQATLTTGGGGGGSLSLDLDFDVRTVP